MGMTSNQDLPSQKVEKAEWSVRRLFPFAAVVSAVSKNFINVFDVLLAFNLFILGAGELLDREMSWYLYAFTMPLLIAAMLERHLKDLITKENGGK